MSAASIHSDIPGGPSANEPNKPNEPNEPLVPDTVTAKSEALRVRKRQASVQRRRRKRQQATADSAQGRPLPHESMTLFWGGSYGTRII